MHSPARKHYNRATAAKAAGNQPAGREQTGDSYELHKRALWEARRTLKGIKSVAAKIEKKRGLLPDFMPYVDGVLAEGKGAQDDVLATILIWCIDTGQLEKALEIGEYAVRHKVETTDHFDRDTVALLAEEVAETVRKRLEEDVENADAAELVSIMQRAADIVGDHDMHDQVKAKLHKSYGYALRANEQPAEALDQLKKALALNDRAGVKQDIQQLEKQLQQNAGQ